MRRANPDAANNGSCRGPMWLKARATSTERSAGVLDPDELLRELAQRVRAGWQERVIFGQRPVCRAVDERRARDERRGLPCSRRRADPQSGDACRGRWSRMSARSIARHARRGRRRRSDRRPTAAPSRALSRRRVCRADPRLASRRCRPAVRPRHRRPRIACLKVSATRPAVPAAAPQAVRAGGCRRIRRRR